MLLRYSRSSCSLSVVGARKNRGTWSRHRPMQTASLYGWSTSPPVVHRTRSSSMQSSHELKRSKFRHRPPVGSLHRPPIQPMCACAIPVALWFEISQSERALPNARMRRLFSSLRHGGNQMRTHSCGLRRIRHRSLHRDARSYGCSTRCLIQRLHSKCDLGAPVVCRSIGNHFGVLGRLAIFLLGEIVLSILQGMEPIAIVRGNLRSRSFATLIVAGTDS